MATTDKLLGTRLKLERAKKHFADLQSVIGAFVQSNPCIIGTKRDPETRKLIYYVEEIRAIPDELGLIAGDILFNLRGTLDHLAMQLWLDGGGASGGNAKSVSFPIYDSAEKYGTERAGKVKGMRPAAIKAIDAIEPYQSGKGHQLWVLHELNNIDKHRLLLAVGSTYRSMNLAPLFNREFAELGQAFMGCPDVFLRPADRMYPLKAGDELFIDAPDAECNENMQFILEVAFGEPQVSDGDSITKALGEIGQFVDNVVTQLSRLI